MSNINLAFLVEDDPVHIFLTTKHITKSEAVKDLRVFKNGKEAFDRLVQIKKSNGPYPELILLDLNMPVWDGWKFLDALKDLHITEALNIYILTSSESDEDLLRAKTYGLAENYLIKPMTQETLIEVFQKLKKA